MGTETGSRGGVNSLSEGAKRGPRDGQQAPFDVYMAKPNDEVDREVLEKTKSLSRQIITTIIGLDKGLRVQGEDSIIDANFSRVNQTDSIPELSREEAIERCATNIGEIDDIGLRHLAP